MKKEVDPIAIRIITDSTCDLSREDQARLDVQILPLTVSFANDTYLDGIDLTNEEFYNLLDASDKLPTTAQVAPQAFYEAFKKYTGAGDEIVGIFISGKISGTYNSACTAKGMLGAEGKKVYVVDSRSASMSLALLLSEAAKLRDEGLPAAQIAEHVGTLTKKVRFLAAIHSLKYLRLGGRVSATTAVIGEILGMKPIVSMINGTVQSVGKARGTAAAIESILKKIMKDMPNLKHNIVFANSVCPDLLNKMIECFKKPLKLTEWLTVGIGSVIGTYSGRGVVGIAYIAR